MSLLIGVPREVFPEEKRVATVPEVVEKLIKLGFAVAVESGAGEGANFDDDAYRAAGAEVVGDAAALYGKSDVVFKVRAPNAEEVGLLRAGTTLVSFIWPAQNPELMQQLAARKVTVLAIDALPRQLSRAQKMDALTSMAGVSGYRAVIEAANAFGRFFNGQITAAGKIPPAKVFVAGAGVAGLAAVGTAANLGAIVRANDTRAEVADQVVSLGGEFVRVDYEEEGSGGGGYAKVMSEGFQQAQREMYAKQAKDADIIITTALIPGKPAPRLITADMVKSMRPGSVIIDMAGEQGGNCELTVPGEAVVRHGVTIIGYMVVWNVTPSLHTPLMSVTNAISSIIAIGALVQVAPPLDAAGAADRPNTLILGLAAFALVLTAINMFGGFAVTRRMLAMFRK